jgi:hypothetical protein
MLNGSTTAKVAFLKYMLSEHAKFARLPKCLVKDVLNIKCIGLQGMIIIIIIMYCIPMHASCRPATLMAIREWLLKLFNNII